MLSLDALVLVAFGPDDFEAEVDVTDELHRWREVYDLDAELPVPTGNGPLWHTDDGVGVAVTGMGKAAAASTVAGLVATPEVSISDAVVVTVGIAGAAPDAASVGSVVVADAVVDWDLKERTDDGISPFGYRPHDYVWRLDGELVAAAATAARDVELAADDAVGDPDVVVGPTVCGDEFWHGRELAEQAAWLCRQYGVDGYATTEMEDAGTATALDRTGLLDRYLSVRGVANYDRPTAGAEGGGLADARIELGLENAFRAGRAVVSALR